MRAMPSVQRFLSGHANAARTATVLASSVRASTAMERVAAQRAGSGRVRLGGSYTGHEATSVEVMLAAGGGVPRASVPQFAGVGNGQLTVEAVDAAAPLQLLSFTLHDLGVQTATAGLDVRELRIRARTPGSSGNSIRLTVAPALVRAATPWALLAPWSAGQPTQSGPQWDFGGLPLSAQDELDAASPRIQFGFDPQVYRPWRRFKDGAWQYGLSPQLVRDVPAGTPVWAVTGGYVVTVSDGVATETFGDVGAGQPLLVSFYDLLQALATSSLVEVGGVVAADRTVGGQAAIDVPLRTSAWLFALSGKVQLDAVGVPPSAPTQTVTVRCLNADVVGQERWSVVGDVSGALDGATTGVPYSSPACAFTVPRKVPPAGNSGRWSFKFAPVERKETEGLPSVCVRPFRFGANARPLTVTFVYKRRPPPDCKCSDMPTPKVSLKCLGITEDDDMALDAAYQTRLEGLYAWRRDFHAANWVKYYVAAKDLDFADAIVRTFADCLAEIYESTPAKTEWDAALTAMQADLVPLESPSHEASFASGNLWVGVSQLPATETVGTFSGDIDAMTGRPALSAPGTENMYGTVSVSVADLVRKYAARMDYVRTLAGIVPKSNPGGGDAGGCWVDHGDAFWWVDADGYYLPAFTNQAYVSARRNTETGVPYSTMEFGFGLVVACPDRLKVDDSITIRIDQVDQDRPYNVGDEASIQTIGAGEAWLAGGVDGTDVQTWLVQGSVSGALPDYLLPTDGTPEPLYSHAGVDVRLGLGGIPFALGDSFSFAVEAGQYQWRKEGGAWSALADIPPSGPAALPDGLQVWFDAGAAPSFVPGDAYSFAVHQPWAASHVQDALASVWGWDGSSASMVLDLGAVQPLGAIALARYKLPEGAAVSAEFSLDGIAWSAPLVLDVSRSVSVCVFHLAMAAQFVRFSITGAPGGHIGWVWCGEPLATEHHASSCARMRRWASTRGGGLNAAALYAGVGDGWKLSWENALLEPDVAALLQLGDWAQAHDEPLLFVPHHMHEGDASLVRWGADALQVNDIHEYQPDVAALRLMSATLDLEPVFA